VSFPHLSRCYSQFVHGRLVFVIPVFSSFYIVMFILLSSVFCLFEDPFSPTLSLSLLISLPNISTVHFLGTVFCNICTFLPSSAVVVLLCMYTLPVYFFPLNPSCALVFFCEDPLANRHTITGNPLFFVCVDWMLFDVLPYDRSCYICSLLTEHVFYSRCAAYPACEFEGCPSFIYSVYSRNSPSFIPHVVFF